MVPFTIAAPPAPFVPPAQDHLSAAMAKRDEIAKKFAMMGKASVAVPSIPPPMGPPAGPPSMPHVGSPAGQYNAGPSRGQSCLDSDNRDLGGESYSSRAGGAWNSPPQPGRFDRNAPASTSGWRPQARGRSRSPSRAASRPEPARSGRAPLPGAGQPGKDEFGRDLGSRRSQSPQRDRAAFDRSRSDVERDATVKVSRLHVVWPQPMSGIHRTHHYSRSRLQSQANPKPSWKISISPSSTLLKQKHGKSWVKRGSIPTADRPRAQIL